MNAKYLIRKALSAIVPQYPSNFIPQRLAFTLAEVLITLGIIGVVAAMTMPTLIQHFQKKSLETQTQRFYSMMSQAVKQYMADYGVDDLRNTPLLSFEFDWYTPEVIATVRDFVTKSFKVAKECEGGETYVNSGCFPSNYRNFTGTPYDNWESFIYNEVGGPDSTGMKDYVFADGSVVKVGLESFGAASVVVLVDVNGKKGPNRVGYDLWMMDIYHDGSIGSISPECKLDSECYAKAQNQLCKRDELSYRFECFKQNNFKFDY